MSATLISHSPDLKRLVEDGYELEILGGHLVLHNIPYVDSASKIRRGKLVSALELAGDRTVKPNNHVAMFAGDHPCNQNGEKLRNMVHGTEVKGIADGVTVTRSFSCKPPDGYTDYYHKMTTYAVMISGHAEQIDPAVTARTLRVIESTDDDSPFNYIDNASGRAGITAHARKLELPKIGIVGLGGTGSYVLDHVSKTPVREIHTFDGDRFGQHNAFRSPCPPTIEQLRERLYKVDYFRDRYSAMHRGIVPHPVYVDESNVHELKDFDFVFLCMDGRPGKEAVIRKLEEFSVPFIDTGMGIDDCEDGLRGVLRVTTSTPGHRDHIWKKQRIPIGKGGEANIYASNIQISELNSLNADLAIIRWKKYFGFYADLEDEHFTTYTLDGNSMTNEDKE